MLQPKHRTIEQAARAHERKLRALELRHQGLTYRAIAAELGYTGPSAAFEAVRNALRETLREPADAVRQLELQRLDAMLQSVWPAALGGHLVAQAHVLRLMDRRARYLGLDAPARIDVEHRIRVLAQDLGLDPDEAVAEAQRILATGERV